MRAAWSVVLLAACAPSTVEPRAPQLRAEPIPPLVEVPFVHRPAPVPAKPLTLDRYGARDLFEPVIHGHDTIALEAGWRSSGNRHVVDVAEIDYLGRCAREFVVAQPEPTRRSLVVALSHYVITCDPDGKLVLDRPLGFDSRDRRTRSDAVFLGTLAPRGAGLVLRVTSCNAQSSFERVSLVGRELSWTSPRLEVRRDANHCEFAELAYTKALAKVIASATESESVLRFDGAGNELPITDQVRDELRSVLAAIDAITEP